MKTFLKILTLPLAIVGIALSVLAGGISTAAAQTIEDATYALTGWQF